MLRTALMGENPSRFQIVTGRNRTTEHREIANTLANAADRWHGRFSGEVVALFETKRNRWKSLPQPCGISLKLVRLPVSRYHFGLP
jgi:hypothetical protein